MNTKQLQYVIELAKIRNFSQVADMFHISQPALSKQILSLEKELDIKLFNRSSIPLTLTAAGEHFVQEAQFLLYKEDQLLRSMEQFKSGKKGKLVIGVSPFRNLYLMPPILQKVKEVYPGIQIILHEATSDQLRKETAEGKYDFAIVNLPIDDSLLDYTPLEPETLVLAVPNHLTAQMSLSNNPDSSEINISDCKKLPFIVVAHPQEMRQYFDKICASADFTPNIAIEVVGGISTAWSMARTGLGATLLPMQFVLSQHFDDSLRLFTIKDKSYSRQPVIITKRGQYLSDVAQHAITLLSNISANTIKP